SGPVRDRLPAAAGQERRRHLRVPLLGAVLDRRHGLGPGRRLGGLEGSHTARLLLRRPRREPDPVHARPRHPPRPAPEWGPAELLRLSLRRARRQAVDRIADELLLPGPREQLSPAVRQPLNLYPCPCTVTRKRG